MEKRTAFEHGIIYRNTDTFFRYNGWASVCKDDEGTLYTVWSGARARHVCPFGKTLMSKSTDGGRRWSVPMIINDTWLDDRDAGITYLGDGKLLLSYFHHPKDAYSGIWRDARIRILGMRIRASGEIGYSTTEIPSSAPCLRDSLRHMRNLRPKWTPTAASLSFLLTEARRGETL